MVAWRMHIEWETMAPLQSTLRIACFHFFILSLSLNWTDIFMSFPSKMTLLNILLLLCIIIKISHKSIQKSEREMSRKHHCTKWTFGRMIWQWHNVFLWWYVCMFPEDAIIYLKKWDTDVHTYSRLKWITWTYRLCMNDISIRLSIYFYIPKHFQEKNVFSF